MTRSGTDRRPHFPDYGAPEVREWKERFRAELKTRGLTFSQASRLLGTNPSWVANILNLGGGPSKGLYQKVLETFGVS